MNIKIGAVSSIVNLLAVLGFATSMLLHFNFGSYLCSMFIAFSFDLLGYALMALATFFAGLTICPKKKADKWVRALLLIHGAFFISCLLLPILGIFQVDSPAWIGVAVLEFWCAYFCPVTILSFLYFQSKEEHVNEAIY